MNYDKIIIGAGLYGLYSALECGKRGQKVLVIEHDDAPFKRATISIRHVYIWVTIIQEVFLQQLSQLIILNGLMKIMVSVFILSLIRYMRLLLIFHGLMRSSLGNFARRQISAAKMLR